MRVFQRIFMALALAGLLVSCDRRESADANAPGPGSARVLPQIDPHSPYAGTWALAASSCGDAKKLWTIEPRRMGIRPDLRFCAFRSIQASQTKGSEDALWSASADCLAEGRQSRAYVFFRLRHNLREMRVTFNDDRPTDLVRCLEAS